MKIKPPQQYSLAELKKLFELTKIGHPAVRIPKTKTLEELLFANPRKEFLKRLAASNN